MDGIKHIHLIEDIKINNQEIKETEEKNLKQFALNNTTSNDIITGRKSKFNFGNLLKCKVSREVEKALPGKKDDWNEKVNESIVEEIDSDEEDKKLFYEKYSKDINNKDIELESENKNLTDYRKVVFNKNFN